jgi:hypothetical protein
MKGFKPPRIDTSAGGKALCISGTVDVRASANNVHIKMQEPANQAEITGFLLENVETDSTLVKRVVSSPNNVTKIFGIYSQICFPNGNGKSNATTIQFLTCGAEADRNYWSKAPKYSYVDYTAE